MKCMKHLIEPADSRGKSTVLAGGTEFKDFFLENVDFSIFNFLILGMAMRYLRTLTH